MMQRSICICEVNEKSTKVKNNCSYESLGVEAKVRSISIV